jgi:hypothetical protein
LAINDSGEVDSAADVSRPCAQISHAFLWERYVMTDLGTVDGDTCSYANAINSSEQIVGESRACDFSVQHAVYGRTGKSSTLNTRIPRNSALYLTRAFAINDRGDITGVGVPSGCLYDNQCGHAFVLIPCDQDHSGVERCDYSLVDPTAAEQLAVQRDLPSETQHPPQSRLTNGITYLACNGWADSLRHSGLGDGMNCPPSVPCLRS